MLNKIKDLVLKVTEFEAAYAQAKGEAATAKANLDTTVKQLVEAFDATKRLVES